MAIKAAVAVQSALVGDGTSTAVTLDLRQIPLSFELPGKPDGVLGAFVTFPAGQQAVDVTLSGWNVSLDLPEALPIQNPIDALPILLLILTFNG